MDRKILSVGFPSFPLGFAQVQRQLLLAKALLIAGFEVTVLCRYGIHKKEDGINGTGIFEGINYIYCSGTAFRPGNYIKRNLLKIIGLFNEVKYIGKISKSGQLSGLIITTNSFHNILIYYFISRIFNIRTVVDNVEYWTSIKGFKGFIWVEKYLYDKFYYLFSDHIICISDFLINKVGKLKRTAVIKIPAVTDFDKFASDNNSPRIINGKYFVYCGSVAYFETINFVITSFEKAKIENTLLVLVTINSSQLMNRINQSKRNKMIKILTNLAYEDLVSVYKNCEALVLPMRYSDQDRARFPHKISEYCASKKPIITNDVGEIGNYFSNANAFLCNDYSEDEFAAAMEKVIAEPEKAAELASNSYKTGIEYFNYKSYTTQLNKIFNTK